MLLMFCACLVHLNWWKMLLHPPEGRLSSCSPVIGELWRAFLSLSALLLLGTLVMQAHSFALCSDNVTVLNLSNSMADFPVAITEVFTVGNGNNRAVFTDQQIWWLGAQSWTTEGELVIFRQSCSEQWQLAVEREMSQTSERSVDSWACWWF